MPEQTLRDIERICDFPLDPPEYPEQPPFEGWTYDDEVNDEQETE
jgi:hypothetical protein